jgi:hypothetical protein
MHVLYEGLSQASVHAGPLQKDISRLLAGQQAAGRDPSDYFIM